MSRLASLSLSVAALSLLGCDLYGDDCEEVYYDEAQPQEFRNPDSGQCESWGSGGGYYTSCDGQWAAPGNREAGFAEPQPDWPQCYSSCDGLGEEQCQETAGCQAAYLEDQNCTGDDCVNFYACWATSPSVGNDIACEELGSWDCIHRDDCSRVHQRAALGGGGSDPNVGFFVECAPEDKTPAWGTCFGEIACDSLAPECPAGTVAGIKDGCYSGWCIPDDALTCDDGGDPGQCYAVATCEVVEPDCPENTVPGIADDCYTGWCIPADACEPAPACGSLTTEAQCLSVELCSPLYEGVNCDCQGNSCTCESYVFDRCEDA